MSEFKPPDESKLESTRVSKNTSIKINNWIRTFDHKRVSTKMHVFLQ